MRKCILLVRVSTERQEFDDQERELYEMAIADGYTEENIIPIAEKESGRKLVEEERAGLNRMKELIESDNSIDCVYAWEVSRIARRKKINFSVLEYLEVRKKQLIIKTPFIKLFNDDGSVNEGAEIVFTLFSQMAESEVRNREARFARTKKEFAKTMRYSGGPVKFGYKIVDGMYTINEEEAEIIRFIFDSYINKNEGYTKIWRECTERGYNISHNGVTKILDDTTYIGIAKKGQTTYDRAYPQILSNELFETAQKMKLIKNRTVVKTKAYWFGNKLIKCPTCGGFYYANKGSKVYQCFKHSLNNKDSDRCPNRESISINFLDSILWNWSKHEEARYLGKKASEDIASYLNQNDVLIQKIETAKKQLEKEEANIERIADNYVAGLYNKNKRDEKIKETKNNIIKINNKISNWKLEINHINDLIKTIEGRMKIQLPIISGDDTRDELMVKAMKSVVIEKNVNSISNLKEMYEIIHRHIANVTIEDCIHEGKMSKKIEIIPYSGIVATYYFHYKIGKRALDAKPKPQIFREYLTCDGGIESRPCDFEIMDRLKMREGEI